MYDRACNCDPLHHPQPEELQGGHEGGEAPKVQAAALQMVRQELPEEVLGRPGFGGVRQRVRLEDLLRARVLRGQGFAQPRRTEGQGEGQGDPPCRADLRGDARRGEDSVRDRKARSDEVGQMLPREVGYSQPSTVQC